MGQTTTPCTETAPAAADAKQPEPEQESANSQENRPAKKARAERTPKAPKPASAKPKSSGEQRLPRKKRGPARPHRRLDIVTIDSRIDKLEKRRVRAKEQLEDATRHVEGYLAERNFRAQEAAAEAAQAAKE